MPGNWKWRRLRIFKFDSCSFDSLLPPRRPFLHVLWNETIEIVCQRKISSLIYLELTFRISQCPQVSWNLKLKYRFLAFIARSRKKRYFFYWRKRSVLYVWFSDESYLCLVHIHFFNDTIHHVNVIICQCYWLVPVNVFLFFKWRSENVFLRQINKRQIYI